MVLYVVKYDIAPGKEEAYMQWSPQATKRTMGIPGMLEFRAYRAATGNYQVVLTYEFADMPSWGEWQCTEEQQKLMTELHTFATNVTSELWGPSPVIPAPLRPGK